MKMPSLALSRDLLDWLRSDPQWARQPLRLRAALAWKAHWGRINARLSEAQPPAPSARPLAPLLILGPWRSGTTVMHELLTAATGWATPLTWQCMDACAFRLTGRPRAGVTIARPMDGLALGPHSPQEDEFALLTLGVASAYRAFWMPHRIGELHATLRPDHWLADDRWFAPWEAFLCAVQADKSEGGLILKSPNHTFRAPAVLRRFPDAKVVWMLRDPADTFHSNRKMWRAMFAEHGLTPPDADALDAFLAAALRESAAVLDWARRELPAGQFVCCSQEALRDDPRGNVERVLGALGLGRELDAGALQRAIEQTRAGRVERYDSMPPPVAQAAIELLRAAQERAATAA